MPSLGELECQIEEANTSSPFEEHGTLYGDGVVETYIVIPGSPQNFSISLRSKGYISEGLAALVFMDGEYQCNRNRLNLKPPKKGLPRSSTEINFRMRQKEKPVGDGSFIGREWRFDTHNQIPDLPQDAHSGHFDHLGTIEVLVLRCSSNDDTGSTSSSALDVDPLSHTEIKDSASDLEDATQEQDTNPGYVAPAVVEEDDGGSFLSGIGLFDGTNDRSDQPSFGRNGYWSYHSYQHGPNMYNESQPWGPQPRYHPAHPPPGFPPQARPPPIGPGKRVHFDMGGRPSTRAEPLPQHLPVPLPTFDPSDHGAGQQSGYPMSTQPVPFDAIPPLPGPQMPGYCVQAGWGGQGHIPYPIHLGYGYGYGAEPSFRYPHPGFYQEQGYGQGQCYGPSQGGPVHGPAANQDGNMNRNTGDPAKDQNNQGDAWGENNNTSGDWASGSKDSGGNGDDDWHKVAGNNDTSGGAAGDWSNDVTGNDNAHGGGNDNSWNNDGNRDDANGETKNDSSNQVQMGDTFTAPNSQQNNSYWENNDSGNNQTNEDWTQNNKSSSNQNQNHAEGAKDWGLTRETNTSIPPFPPSMPGSFPCSSSSSSLPRTLHGPHGPYYLPYPPPTTHTAHPTITTEEPRYDVPQSHIAATRSTHQVVPGQGYIYSHRLATPCYRDSVSRPYARFVFKYRNAAQLAAELGISVDGCNPSAEDVEELAAKSKEDVIAMLLRAKAALGGKIPGMGGEEEEGEEEEKKRKKVEPMLVPAPVRRLKEYKIPVRGWSRARPSTVKVAGLGLSNHFQNSSRQQFGNGSANGSGNDAARLGGGSGNGPYNNSNWSGNTNNNNAANGTHDWRNGNKGDAGARPESSAGGSPTPQYQDNDNYGESQAWGGAAETGGAVGGATVW